VLHACLDGRRSRRGRTHHRSAGHGPSIHRVDSRDSEADAGMVRPLHLLSSGSALHSWMEDYPDLPEGVIYRGSRSLPRASRKGQFSRRDRRLNTCDRSVIDAISALVIRRHPPYVSHGCGPIMPPTSSDAYRIVGESRFVTAIRRTVGSSRLTELTTLASKGWSNSGRASPICRRVYLPPSQTDGKNRIRWEPGQHRLCST